MAKEGDLLAIWWITDGILGSICGLRVWMFLRHRTPGSRSFKAPDISLVISFVLATVGCALGTWLVVLIDNARARAESFALYIGSSLPPEIFLTVEEVRTGIRGAFVTYIVFICLGYSCKTTLACIYLANLRHYRRSMQIAIISGTIYLAATFLGVLFLQLFLCGPRVSANWDIEQITDLLDLRCLAPLSMPGVVTFTVCSVTTDLVLMAIGIATIQTLITTARQKTAIIFIFVIGLLSMAASITRCALLIQEIDRTVVALHIQKIMFWLSIETVSVGLSCSLPTLRAMIGQIDLKRSRLSSTRSRQPMATSQNELAVYEYDA